jgi:hypothetical protein
MHREERTTERGPPALNLDLKQTGEVDRGGRQVRDGHGTHSTQFLLLSIVATAGIAKETEYSDLESTTQTSAMPARA